MAVRPVGYSCGGRSGDLNAGAEMQMAGEGTDVAAGPGTGSITLLIRGLGSASRPFRETAAREIHTRYGERLAALAQQRLSMRMRRRLDAEDITQSVFKSLFLRVADGRLVVENREDLGALL
ncbi:MAG: hypothetical protein ACKOJF_35330, partial [Planctomycetaceae bacterium]